jgi:hypothetical protein
MFDKESGVGLRLGDVSGRFEAEICEIRRRPMATRWWAGFRYAGVECGDSFKN